MKKTYVIDTNVLIQSPEALHCFAENNLVLPLVVLEELDGLKKSDGEKGANARAAVRLLETYRQKGDLLKGVALPSGGTLRVEKNFVSVTLPEELPEDKSDNRILKVCKGLWDSRKRGQKVILVTKDIVLRLKAQMLGIPAEDFISEQAAGTEYTGRCNAYLPEELVKSFKKSGVELEQLYQTDLAGNRIPYTYTENEFVVLEPDQSGGKTLLGRVKAGKIVPLKHKKAKPYGVTPRNVGQYFLQEALMTKAEDAPLVIVQGMAGTAKTFYALAVGLEQVYNAEQPAYRKILICRPNAQFDDEIGFLPGTEQEKIAPLLRPIWDNLEQILDGNKKSEREDAAYLSDRIQELFDRGVIQAEAMNFIRGRSITDTYLIIDEAQNMTPNQMRGIITRAGIGTKIILLGDPNQIDKPFLDERTNGLSYAAKNMKGSPYCWQITLSAEECERSALAMDAVKRLQG